MKESDAGQQKATYLTFERNCGQNPVKSTLAIGGNNHQLIAGIIGVPYLREGRFAYINQTTLIKAFLRASALSWPN
jgi:hypothetical protein